MFSKVMGVLGIVLYFDCICLFCFRNDLYHDYKKEVVDLQLNNNTNTTDVQICSISTELWVRLCNRVLVDLRESYEKYENTLYLKHKAFTVITNDKCKGVKVRVPLLSEPVEQIVLYCYAGRPLDESFNSNPEFYKRIAIYSHANKQQLLIFERSENTDEFNLLQWTGSFPWERLLVPYSSLIFRIPVPEQKWLSKDNDTVFKERRITNIKNNVLTTSRHLRVHNICTFLYARQPYSEKFVLDENESHFSGRSQNTKVLLPSGREIYGPTYTCLGFLKNSNTETSGYRIMPGLEINDILVVIDEDNNGEFKAVELIHNLTREYLHLMFPTSHTDAMLCS